MSTIQFSVSKKFLQSIDTDYKQPLIFIFPTLNALESEEESNIDCSYVLMMQALLKERFNQQYTQENSQYLLINMFHEPLRNAMEHGNKFDSTKSNTMALWIGKKGVLFAFRDEGNFFSLPATKELYESRSFVPTTRLGGVGGGGTDLLFEVAKDILVATEENTLYVSYLLRP